MRNSWLDGKSAEPKANSGRWLQARRKCYDPGGDGRNLLQDSLEFADIPWLPDQLDPRRLQTTTPQ